MSTITITVPDLSGAEDVDVIEVLVKAGDTVAEGDSLMALETDKASMEVPAEQAGTVVEVMIKEGDTCNEGDVILTLETGASEAAEPAQEAPAEAAPAPAAAPAPQAAAPAAATATTQENVLVPDLSGATDVDVIEVMVKAGDVIEEGDSLIALETDKASMEVPAPKGGKVLEVKIAEGSTCNEGDLLIVLEVGGSAAENAAPEQAAAPAQEAAAPAAAPAPAPAQAGGKEDVLVPDLSGATDVDVIEVMVKVGDVIEEGDSLIALETDKASMEVPAPKGGKVIDVKISEGATVNEGDLIVVLEVAGAAPAPTAAPAAAPSAPAASAPAPKPEPAKATAPSAPAAASNLSGVELEKKNRAAHAGPAVRALAREFGVDLSSVTGTGRKGRIFKEDVQAYVKSALQQLKNKPAAAVTAGSGIPAIPAVDFSKFG
ncbi:biotin/lipoyl-containing protein, partial [Neptunomonas phycophila]|uniref:biotin/lipoyl-containing protein n=1 Tax=Neptunomonas phycophila TaxID=1572645 RepID=UPI0035137758